MNVEYVDEENMEPLFIDIKYYDLPPRSTHPLKTNNKYITLDECEKILSRKSRVSKQRKSRSKPIKLNKPIEVATFASLADYLAAIGA